MEYSDPRFDEESFYDGQVLFINKELNWTSFDVVNKMKILITNKFGKKIKIGHAGTLDPLATGLLILCTGKATRKIESFQGQDKTYIAKIKLGATTPSYDLETAPENFKSTSHINEVMIEKVLENFVGKQEQLPPLFSAKKIKGKKAYEFARKGEHQELKKSEIFIHEIKLLSIETETIEIVVRCSKGTYIRSLANDIGMALGCGAHLTGLVRTAIGPYKLNNAITISEFEKKLSLPKL